MCTSRTFVSKSRERVRPVPTPTSRLVSVPTFAVQSTYNSYIIYINTYIYIYYIYLCKYNIYIYIYIYLL